MRLTGLLFLCACISVGFAANAIGKEYTPGESIDLKPVDGLLAVDVDAAGLISGVKIDRIGALLGGTTLTKLHWGTNVRLIALPAGDYRWSRIDLSSVGLYLRVRDDQRFHFKIEPGVVNYAGDFNVTPVGDGLSYNLDVLDHATRMMAHLDRDFPGVRRRFSLRYQGKFPDRFPQFAAEELGEQSAFDALTAGSVGEVMQTQKDMPPELRSLVTELFAKPQIRTVRLNPRGDLVAMIEYRDGKHRVSLLDTESMLAVDVYRGDVEVKNVYFAGDRTLLFELDQGNGSNNYVVHIGLRPGAVPTFTQFVIPDHGWFIDTTSGDGSHATYVHMESDGSTHIFHISLDGKRFDTSQFRSDLRLDKGLNKAFSGLTDATGTLRLALTVADGDYVVMNHPDPAAPWREIHHYNADEVFRPIMLSGDGNSLIALTNKDRSQTDLVRIALPTGEISETMFSIPGTDIDGVLTREVDRRVLGVMAYHDGILDTHYLDEPDDALRRSLVLALSGESVEIYDSSRDRNRLLVLAHGEIDPGTFYLYDAISHKLQELLSVRSAMSHVQMARSQILRIIASDGTPVESYLTRPTRVKPPFPLVVIPHGGPIGVRDSLEFDPEVQLLVNRGYAVLRVNYRGSGGFGRVFEHAGFHAWGKSIEDDILAAIDAAEKAAPIDQDRVALRGTSYGGYSTLMGLIRTPSRFRCGVAISAVTDVPLLFTASDWSHDKHVSDFMMQVVGDPMKALSEMEAISPDYLYRKLDRPLLIIHGALDRRAPIEHALRLLLLLGHAKKPPQSLFLAHEGHGITNLDDRYMAEAAIDQLFSTCMSPRQPEVTKQTIH